MRKICKINSSPDRQVKMKKMFFTLPALGNIKYIEVYVDLEQNENVASNLKRIELNSRKIRSFLLS